MIRNVGLPSIREAAQLACSRAVLAAVALGFFLPATASAQELRKVSFGLPVANINSSYCMFPVATAMGYFSDEGLDVSINQIGGSTAVVQNVLSGGLDVGGAIAEPILKAISDGYPLTMTYNYVRRSAASVAVLEDSPIQSLMDLRGKKLGAQSLGSGNIMLTNAILSKLGIDPKTEITYLSVGIGGQALQAVRSGHVDGLVLFDSLYAQMEAAGAKFRYFFGEGQDQLFSTQFVMRKEAVEQDPKMVEGFGRAIAKATLFATENPEACVRMMWEVFPTSRVAGMSEQDQLRNDLAVINKRLEFVVPDKPDGWGLYNAADVEVVNAFVAEGGIIPEPFKDVSGLYTNDFGAKYNDFDREKVIQEAKDWKP